MDQHEPRNLPQGAGRIDFRNTHNERPLDFSEDSAGIIWTTDPRRGFSKIGDPGNADPVPFGSGAVIVHDRYGTMWVGTQGQGLWRTRHSDTAAPGLELITVAEGLSSNVVRSLFEDRDGNVWVGTESALHRFTRRKAKSLTDIGFTWATQSAAETTNYGSRRLTASSRCPAPTRRRYGVQDGLPSGFVRALTTDIHGNCGWLRIGVSQGAEMMGDSKLYRLRSACPALFRSLRTLVDAFGYATGRGARSCGRTGA